MKSTGLRYLLLAVSACFVFELNEAQAQAPARGQPVLRRNRKPALSPYLNIAAAQGDPDAASINYLLLTRPQQAAQRFRNQQERQNQAVQGEIDAQRKLLMQSPTSRLGTTGHHAQFQYYGGYYNFNRQ